jgi:hypothetical protein
MTAPPDWSALSHDDRLWLLGYLSRRDPAAFALALAALAGSVARQTWQTDQGEHGGSP